MKRQDQPPSEEFQLFQEFTKRLMSVPKSEIEKRMAEYNRKKAAKKRKPRDDSLFHVDYC